VKKLTLLAVLLILTIAQVYLLTAFLPAKWQHAIDDRVSNILPSSNDWTPITHPLLSREIDRVLHDRVELRVALYTLTVALLVGNALLIRFVWRFLRSVNGAEGNSRS